MSQIIDCSQRIEANWNWNTTTFISQAYKNNDQFQEFGLKWCGSGFTYITTPKWINSKYKSLDSYDISLFCGPAVIIDLPNKSKVDSDHVEKELQKIDNINEIEICIISTKHSKNFTTKDFNYWKNSPLLDLSLIDTLKKFKIKHLVLDFNCESIFSKRTDDKINFINPNENFKIQLLENDIVLTENFVSNNNKNTSYYIGLPISIPNGSTSPTRPILINDWFKRKGKIIDVATPLFNHWRWKLDIWENNFDDYLGQPRNETNFIFSGHGFNHCDAPIHMNRDGKTIQELPNEGLDIFINEANLIDMSEYELPFKVTKEIIESKIKDCDKKNLIILRSDLTNKVGYESREWHLKSPSIELEAANWIVDNKFKSVCLDFPQDFIAREMPDRMVYNEEFEIHHKIFDNGITFIEDLMNLGEITNNTTQICAVPLKMDCLDGAPMRTVAIDWF